MLRRRFKKLNNKAFTLIEILLAITLLAVATVAIGSVIISTQNNTAEMFNEAELQQQLAEAQETFHNEILATTVGMKFWTQDDKNDEYKLVECDDGGEYEKIIAFYSVDFTDYVLTKTYYRYNSDDKTLSVAGLKEVLPRTDGKVELSVDEDLQAVLDEIGENWTIVSKNMNGFTMDATHHDDNNLISFTMEIKQNGVSYPTDDTVYIRNDIAFNTELSIDKFHTVFLVKPSLENAFFTYDGQTHAPTEVNYFERFMTRTGDLSADQAGNYHITYQLKDKETTKWEDGSTGDITCTWTINKRTVGLNWGTTTWVYDLQEHSTTCEPINEVEGEDCGLVLQNNLVGPDVGTVICTAEVSNPNYKVPNDNSVNLIITKAPPSVDIWTVDRTYRDDRVPQNMTDYENLVGGDLKYYISTSTTAPSDSNVSNDLCQAVDASTYHIWYKIVSNNHNYSDTEVFYLGSAKMNRNPTANVRAENKTYNEDVQQGLHGQYFIPGGEYEATNAGSYTATAVPDNNHLWDDGTGTRQKTLSWQIYKAQGQVTAPTPIAGLIYNDDYQTLVTAGSTLWGTIYYKLDDGEWSTELPQAKNAGTYAVYYYSDGDSNHEPTSQSAYVTAIIGRRNNAKVTTTDHVFDGNLKVGVTGEHVTIDGMDTGTYVNGYTAYATPDSNHTWPDGKDDRRPFTWEITKADGHVVAPTAKTLTYNGSAQTLINAGSTKYGEVRYCLTKNGTYSTSLPEGTDAGTYTVWYYSTGDDNHNATEKTSITVTIARRKNASAGPSNKVYNTKEQTGVTGNGVTWSATYKATNVGTYTAKATPDKNHLWSNGGSEARDVVWKITQAAGSVTAPTANDLTYNGNDQDLVTAGSTPYGQIVYSTSEDGTYAVTIPTGKDAGSYDVWYYSTGNTNYAATAPAKVTVTIKRAQTASVTVANPTYSGSAQNGYSAKSNVTLGGDYSATNAGNYTFTATPTSNYAWSDGGTDEREFDWTMERARTASVTKTNRTYTGNAQDGYSAKANVTLDGDHSATAVGEYTFKATPKANYAWSDGTTGEKEFTWKINKAAGNVTAPTAITGLVYNGSAQTLISAGSTSYGSVKYSLSETGTYSTTLPTGTNAGTYTVWYYSTGDSTHAATAKKSISVTIGKAVASAEAADKTYNGKEQTGVTGSGVTWGGTTKATNAGDYTAKATPDSNHTWSDGKSDERDVTWTMSRKVISVSVDGSPYNYTGSTISVKLSGDTGCVTTSGDKSATEPGDYKVKVTPTSNYCWSGGGTDAQELSWTIKGYTFKKGDTVKVAPSAAYYAQAGNAIRVTAIAGNFKCSTHTTTLTLKGLYPGAQGSTTWNGGDPGTIYQSDHGTYAAYFDFSSYCDGGSSCKYMGGWTVFVNLQDLSK